MKIRYLFKDKILTISNFLTLLRITVLPFIVYYMNLENITGDRRYTFYVLGFFIIVIFSDFFDGLLARSFNQVSKLGQFLDPVADKICLIILGTSLIFYKGLPLWIFAVIIAREIFVVASALLLFYRKDVEVKPNLFGKLGVAFMSLTAVLYFLSCSYKFFGILGAKELSAYLTLIFYITGSVLYVKTYSVYCTDREKI
ncbi:MAG TPA: CDP-alcohol phosphatidyltransferase family protein [Spirochaetota bacterium]|nr:CDP-alcohol phosphatidyltransferase family protein [Spirochaetota bacterium]HPF05306.1 CDP-alcohol phosphatidyltransferase family protein [Spirochaetota bacterium]HPJ41044.1 CDP-alcohol phosphatidyltransferase family protein [Spirochaetota bacterium]HPR36330.1 CDP-alcohol phosphatidyltransferase family protein [Spirochaetota bacterium]HRX46731.1 CDP-alcohol phosphatidyltransferase family protein [Spirochaetota bacterium]